MRVFSPAERRLPLRSRRLRPPARRVLWRVFWLAKLLLKAPILAYRYTLSPFIGQRCRHLPTCSEYALEAIDKNGAWKGFWLMTSRLCRCHPWGTSGFDPAPDLHNERHPWYAPWRYGRWSWRRIPSASEN